MTFTRTALRALAAVSVTACVTTLVAAPADAATHHRGAISVHVTKKHRVSGPDHTRPGLVQIKNTGSHAILVVRGKHGHGASRLVTDLNRHSDSAGARLVKDFSVIAELTPHSDDYVTLTRGSYEFAGDTDKTKASWVHTLRVSGAKRNATAPKSHAVSIDKHGRLAVSRNAERNGYLHLHNSTGTVRIAMLFGVGSRTSDADLADLVAHPSDDAFSKLDIVSFGDPQLIGAHRSLWAHTRLHAGRYVVLAVPVTTSDDFTPHKGQLAVLRVR